MSEELKYNARTSGSKNDFGIGVSGDKDKEKYKFSDVAKVAYLGQTLNDINTITNKQATAQDENEEKLKNQYCFVSKKVVERTMCHNEALKALMSRQDFQDKRLEAQEEIKKVREFNNNRITMKSLRKKQRGFIQVL